MFLHMPIFQTITNLLAETTRATVVDDEVAGDADEPPERGLSQLHIQDKDQADSFKRQLYISPPRNQCSLLSKMLTSPISAPSDGGSSTGADALSDSGYTSRNTTPTPPPPVALHLPPPAYPQTKGIIRFANPTTTTNNTNNAADANKKEGECTVNNGLKRSIKFACTGGKETSRESSSSAIASDAPREKRVALASHNDHEVVHPQPQRILRVDDVLLKEREISRLNAEVEAEENGENEDDDDEDDANRPSLDDPRKPSLDDDQNEGGDMQDDDDEDDDDNNGSDDGDEQYDLSPAASSSPVLAPGSVRGKMLARVQCSPCIEYESEEDEDEEFHGNIEDGYASDDDDDGMSEYNGPAANMQHGELMDRLLRHRPMSMVQRTATPPANLIPDSSDFVCGTFDEDRPIEIAYYSALEEHARYNHRPCPQDIDPSFPEDVEDESEEEKSDSGSESSRRPCRSPPPVHHSTRHHHNVPVPIQKHRTNRSEHGGKATSFQHNRPLLRNHLHSNNNINKSANRERGAIDIVKGLERKNNRRRERRHQHQQPHHDIIPGEGVEKMRQLGLVAVRKGENPYAEWMLSV
ncbi:hypothetical protein V1525DRAFT_426416 [Lipomyces kononenkoae]|uniref:Uncharacterized protein n=1 Tax=Lipomyces kononenkoae TaxID=34357 RepID=A0ACC3T078_LIPKO